MFCPAKIKSTPSQRGDVLLFNPGDNHACVQSDGGTLDYRGFNITKEVMLDLTVEVTGRRELPGFSQNVISDEEVICYLCPLHELVIKGSNEFEKEETLLLLISLLIQQYGQPFESCIPECREEIEKACAFMEQHYAGRIYLDQICRYAGLSKSTLLRAFAKSKGVTPEKLTKAEAACPISHAASRNFNYALMTPCLMLQVIFSF